MVVVFESIQLCKAPSRTQQEYSTNKDAYKKTHKNSTIRIFKTTKKYQQLIVKVYDIVDYYN